VFYADFWADDAVSLAKALRALDATNVRTA
jgi:hypothetical protein